jgi:D-threo-aldose 1-dehydrogenase
VGIVIGSPFASGILATGSAAPNPLYNYVAAPPEIVARTREIEAICNRHGVALKAAAIQFPLLHPLVANVLCGAIGAAQARENAGLIDLPIPASFWEELRRNGLIHPGSIPASH